MQIKNALRVAILLALYGFAGADVTAGAGSGTLCYWTGSAAEGRSHYSFLRLPANARPRSLQLYHSVWTLDRRLVDCAVTDEPAVTESYLSLCRGEQAENFTDVVETRFDVSLLFAPGNPCADPFPAGDHASKRTKREMTDPVLAESRTGVSSEVKLRRQKRAWIIPGTVWCGSGTNAANYDDLGIFAQTDKCCREHDHCADIIPSFRFGYGVFNRHIFTVLHCDCDERFRQCLLTANDRVSNMVGYGYFNLIKTPCFTFTEKMQCVQKNWFGMCTLSKMSPFAVLQDPMEFNSTQPTPAVTPGTRNVTSDSPSPTPNLVRNVTSDSVSTTPTPVRKITSNSISPMLVPNITSDYAYQTTTTFLNVTSSTAGFGQPPARRPKPQPPCHPVDPTHQRVDPGSENALPTARPRTPQPVQHNQLAPMEDTRKTETQQPCDCYKHLDECRLKIPPLGERFGLKNPERKTLYHCNCTNRLAQQLQDQEEPDGVQSLLVDFVSLSCFLLPPPEECPGTAQGCPGVLSDASHLRLMLSQRESGGVGIYPERPILKVKRHNSRKSKRKQSPIKLYKKCLRIMDSKTSKKTEGEKEPQTRNRAEQTRDGA